MPDAIMCEIAMCDQPAKEWVIYLNKAIQKPTGDRVAMCPEHVQREFTMIGLSMVDFDLTRIETAP